MHPLCSALLETSLNIDSACLAVFKVEAGLIGILQILPKVFITADRGGILGIWSAEDFAEIRKIKAHDNSIVSMQCDGSTILTGSSDGKVRLWNLATGVLITELASSEALWEVGRLGIRLAAVFSRNNEVIVEVRNYPGISNYVFGLINLVS